MRFAKWIVGSVLAYVLIVCAVEALAVYMGHQQARDGVAADEDWLVLHTFPPGSGAEADVAGARDTVVAGVEVDGRLYVAANHWPRAWLGRVLANPAIEVTRAGRRAPFLAVQPEGAELARVQAAYVLPLVARVLTGFPPRVFLRLDPR